MVTFAEPGLLMLLGLPAAAVLLVFLRHRRRLADQRRLASPSVWGRLMGGTPATGLARLGLCLAAVAFVILGIARPQWGELPAELSLRTRDVVVALDVSDSMLCADVTPDRLRRGLEIVRRSLPGLDGNRVGVVVFAGDAYPLVPLTTDLNAVAAFLEAVEPGMVGQGGSNLESAVQASLKLLPEEGEGRIVVLVTDGENLQGDPETAAGALEKAGTSLIGLVIGTEAGGPIPVAGQAGSVAYKKNRDGRPVITRADASVMERMVEATRGELVAADMLRPERGLVGAVDAIRTREVESLQRPRRVDRFPIPLTLAALTALGAFVLSPWRRRTVPVVLALIVFCGTAQAQQQASAPQAPVGPVAASQQPDEETPVARPAPEIPWWERLLAGGSRRYARRGMSAWEHSEPDQAVDAFAAARELDEQSPARAYDLGTSLASRGDLENSAPLLEEAEAEFPQAAYNAGTAALVAGRPDQAIPALRRAVLADPADSDARRNLELALKMLEEQENQDQDQKEQEDQDQSEQEDASDDEQKQQSPTPQPQDQGGTPTPTPQQQGGGAQPTPTPTPNPAIFQALDRAENEARQNMQSPTPVGATVEKDW